MSPSKLRSLLQEASEHHRGGNLAAAEKLYARARTAAPESFDALHLSGLLAHQEGRFAEAVALLRRALKLNPKSALCEMRLGLACAAIGHHAAAEIHLRSSLALEPGLAEAWCHLGATLRARSEPADARAAYARALELKPAYAEAHDRLGALVSETEGFAAAVPHFRRAVELNPGNVAGWANLGVALAQSGAPTEALQVFDRVLAAEPSHVLALTGRALVHLERGQVTEAVAAYTSVLDRHPRHHETHSGRLLARHYLDGITRDELFADHLAFDAAVGPLAARPLPNTPEPARRLRLAFLSPDLRAHSVAYFLEPLLAQLDRMQFEVVLYHDHPKVDAVSARLRGQAAVWRHLVGMSGEAVEAVIRSDAPDVLVDLAGHTGLNRLPLFARRLAPVQISYLGYPNTTGLKAMDYRLVDAVTDPLHDTDSLHTEQLVRFAPTAWCYQPPAAAPACAVPPCTAGAPVTFGCFNNFAKVNDSTLHAWARLLAAVPGSRLLLKAAGLGEPAVAGHVRERLERAGLEPARVELIERTAGLAEHLALYARMDIALDTFPYNGTTTTCEALWMGRPVVTLAGDRHAARVGASLLTAVGRTGWIARNWDDYVKIAAELAHDPARLAAHSHSLREALRASPLLDHPGQAARFTAAIRSCWVNWCGQTKAAIST